jgi:hypothetical protein
MLQGQSPEFKPQSHQKKEKSNAHSENQLKRNEGGENFQMEKYKWQLYI